MNIFDQLPKSLKKTVRYILQDIHSIDKLEEIQRILNKYINKRKQQLLKQQSEL
ncbi:LytR family transcriptional regulator [Bacillus sp. V3B]|uniref:LytR family transcriptional regulator n=1 Tax=Bacillus sp. V3B TaxID=2804915 RepID=UPI00210B1C75|nr:LytR family transcriptional regulator [Bacillus sp. V3B]